MQKLFSLASIAMPFVLLWLNVGCRTPEWWAYRSMRCIPNTADSSSHSYWEKCSENEIDEKATDNRAIKKQDLAPEAQPEVASPIKAAISEAPSIRLASFQRPQRESTDEAKADTKKSIDDPLQLPQNFPGANVPPLTLPRRGSDGEKLESQEQKANILKLFPPLPSMPIEPDALPEEGVPIGLEELHKIARENHPGIRAAAASVESARGLMIQAGLPPNPNIGYEADTVRTLNTPGYHGAYLQQTFITAKKLGLAAQAAAVDYANAQIDQRKVSITVQSSIRRSYFQVLAARKRLVLAKALSELSERAYQAQIKLVIAGEAAPYEPLQLRVLTTQAQAAYIRAQQDSIAAWRTLAAAVAVPSMPPSAVEGRIDCPAQNISYDSALAQMIAVHTDLRAAENLISKNRTLVTLADRVPIPDLNVGFVLQRDYTFTPGTTTYNMTVGGAVPVWNQNQGNRIAARSELVRSTQLVTDAENQLISKLATSYGIYKSNRLLASSFRSDALGDQVRAYRGIYQRYLTDPSGISFNDVIVAQQTLGNVLNQYVDILQAQWQSTVDLSELLQAEDMFQMGEPIEVAEIPAI